MKKLISMLILLSFSLSLVFSLASCGNPDGDEGTVETFTVSFDSRGGTFVEAKQVKNGDKVSAPDNPTKVGYRFDGWYLHEEKWSFVGCVVTENITLVAKWNECDYHTDSNSDYKCDACAEFMPCDNHIDSDSNSKCDRCGAEIVIIECSHVDANNDYLCDSCNEPLPHEHVDANNDCLCDFCNEPLPHVDADNDVFCDGCNEILFDGICYHEDIDGDEECELCGGDIVKKTEIKPLWREATIRMMLNDCTSGELSSDLLRYVAGQNSFNEDVDKSVSRRNIAATKETKVSVSYNYWYDDRKNGWGKTIAHIDDLVNSTTIKDPPDVYSTYIYDLTVASVKGYFANLNGTSRGSGKLKGVNYFEFVYDRYNYEKAYNESKNNFDYNGSMTLDDRGFMYDWMKSVTLDPARMYILASDYYIDIARAFLLIPVNIGMLEQIAGLPENEKLTGDRDGDGDVDILDFYSQVYSGEWTYELLMEYAKAAYVDDGDDTTPEKWLGDKRIGFALSAGEVSSTGIIYTPNNNLIEKVWNPEKNVYDLYYTSDSNAFSELVRLTESLLSSDGVVYVNASATDSSGSNSINHFGVDSAREAIRAAFEQNSVLFGDVVMLGYLEENEYQRIENVRGFGAVPVPIYHNNVDEDGIVVDRYLTQVHNVGRAGAIAYNTKKFVECTAYLNYQSTHSSDILKIYFTYNICFHSAGGSPSTVEMLEYIRNNLRTSETYALDYAMMAFSNTIPIAELAQIYDAYKAPYIATDYYNILPNKQGGLEDLRLYFQSAKD